MTDIQTTSTFCLDFLLEGCMCLACYYCKILSGLSLCTRFHSSNSLNPPTTTPLPLFTPAMQASLVCNVNRTAQSNIELNSNGVHIITLAGQVTVMAFINSKSAWCLDCQKTNGFTQLLYNVRMLVSCASLSLFIDHLTV